MIRPSVKYRVIIYYYTNASPYIYELDIHFDGDKHNKRIFPLQFIHHNTQPKTFEKEKQPKCQLPPTIPQAPTIRKGLTHA